MFVLGGCHGQNQMFRRLVHGRTLEEIVKIFSGVSHVGGRELHVRMKLRRLLRRNWGCS